MPIEVYLEAEIGGVSGISFAVAASGAGVDFSNPTCLEACAAERYAPDEHGFFTYRVDRVDPDFEDQGPGLAGALVLPIVPPPGSMYPAGRHLVVEADLMIVVPDAGAIEPVEIFVKPGLQNSLGARNSGRITVQSSTVLPVFGRLEFEVASGSFERADVNGDGQLGMADAIVALSYLFIGSVDVTCLDAADVNDDGLVAIADVVSALRFRFFGEPIAEPLRRCGADPTPDDLGPCDHSCEVVAG